MSSEFLISVIQWASVADLRYPIHEITVSMFASPIPSGAPWSVRSPLSTPWLHGDPRFPKRSGTWWSLMPALCSESRSHGRRCATQRGVWQTGSVGAWLERCVRQRLADADREDSSRADVRALAAGTSSERNDDLRGLWKLPELWTRKRPRAHKLLGRRQTDAGAHSSHSPLLRSSTQTTTRPPNRGRSTGPMAVAGLRPADRLACRVLAQHVAFPLAGLGPDDAFVQDLRMDERDVHSSSGWILRSALPSRSQTRIRTV